MNASHVSSARFERVRPILLPIAFLAVLAITWEWGVAHFRISAGVLAPPSAIYRVYASHASLLGAHLVPTVTEAAFGFVLACVAGTLVGTTMSMLAWVRAALYPHVVAFQLIPKIAVAPLFTLWFGIGSEGRLIFITFMAFFPILVSTVTGLASTPEPVLRLCRALRASPTQTLLQVRLPYALPHIFAGMKVSATMAMLGTVVAEFVTAQKGLGFLIMFGAAAGESAVVLASVGLLCVVGVTLFGLVALAEHVVRRKLGARGPERALAF